MARTRTRISGVVVILLCLVVAMPAYATQRRGAVKRVMKAPEPGPAVEIVPPAPPVPLTLEQQPASPPRVTYQGGQLTIMAQNCTLGDILRAVHAQTGAAVDVPANATERVVGHFGPGPAREVLAALLNGSHFNYVMLGSATNPDALDRLVLTSRAGGSSEGSAVTQFVSRPAPPTPPPAAEAEEDPIADDFSDDQSELDQAQTDPSQEGNQPQDEQQQQQQLQQQGFPNAQPGVRSPEQLLRELQQRQQQGLPPQAQPPGFPVPPGQQQQPPQ